MGSGISKKAVNQGSEAVAAGEVDQSATESKSEDRDEPVMQPSRNAQLSKLRLESLLYALKHIANLQRATSSAQVASRQKRREVGFLQQDVGDCDASFMKELQKIIAQGRLKGFDELLDMARRCQEARDQLGPVERGSMEIEQKFEGQLWRLQQAEDELYEDFAHEFQYADSYSSASASIASVISTSSAASEPMLFQGSAVPSASGSAVDQVSRRSERPHIRVSTSPNANFYPPPAESRSSISSFVFSAPPTPPNAEMPQSLTLTAIGARGTQDDDVSLSNDSATPDIDQMPDTTTGAEFSGPRQVLPTKTPHVADLYPELRSDFKNKRDMMNKWLEQMTLESHIYSTLLYSILETTLEKENKTKPSNWSQLVIAYWDQDGAAIPISQRQKSSRTPPGQNPVPMEIYKPERPQNLTGQSCDEYLRSEVFCSDNPRGSMKRSHSDSTTRTHRKARSLDPDSTVPIIPPRRSLGLDNKLSAMPT